MNKDKILTEFEKVLKRRMVEKGKTKRGQAEYPSLIWELAYILTAHEEDK